MTSILTPTDLLSLSVVWEKIGVGKWQAKIQGTECLLQMNDFPDEPLYTVTVGGLSEDVEDAPPNWAIKN